MRRCRPRRRTHRCMARTDEWIVEKNGRRRRRCLARLSFRPGGDAPPCPSCGSRLHWRDESAHRRKDRKRETCSSGACPILHPHTKHHADCLNNPNAYFDELLGERLIRRPAPPAGEGDVPF